MTTEIRQWGNSLALRIPRAFARETQLADGTAVNLAVRDGRLVVSPRAGKKFRLAALVRQIKPGHTHHESCRDDARGKEVW